jgi:NAD(P)-dependent dehydrogenase (short-subunit alcohol dehydrogenase family)
MPVLAGTLPGASVEVGLVDMGIQASVRRFAAEVMAAHAVVDVVIHNAAAFDVSQKERVVTEEGVDGLGR